MEEGNPPGQYYGFGPYDCPPSANHRIQHPLATGWMTRPRQMMQNSIHGQHNAIQSPIYRWHPSGNEMAKAFYGQIRHGRNYQCGENPAAQPLFNLPNQGIGYHAQHRQLFDMPRQRFSHPTANSLYRMHSRHQNMPCDSYSLPLPQCRDEGVCQQAYARNSEQYVSHVPVMQPSPVLSPRSAHSVDWSAVRSNHSNGVQLNAAHAFCSPSNEQLIAHQSKFRAGVPALSSPATSPPYSPSPACLPASLSTEQTSTDGRCFRSPMTPNTPDNRNAGSQWSQHGDTKVGQNHLAPINTCSQMSSHTPSSSPPDNLAFSPTLGSSQPYRFQWQLGSETETAEGNSTFHGDSVDKTLRELVIPFGWQRVIEDELVKYISPSGVALESIDAVKAYLLTDGTCKCGLDCPLRPVDVFNFDRDAAARPWSLECDGEQGSGKLTVLCAHKRKILAIAAFQRSTLLAKSGTTEDEACVAKSREKSSAAAVKGKAKKKGMRRKRLAAKAVNLPLEHELKNIEGADQCDTLMNTDTGTVDNVSADDCKTEKEFVSDNSCVNTETCGADMMPEEFLEPKIEPENDVVCEAKNTAESESDLEVQVATALNEAVDNLRKRHKRTARKKANTFQPKSHASKTFAGADVKHEETVVMQESDPCCEESTVACSSWTSKESNGAASLVDEREHQSSPIARLQEDAAFADGITVVSCNNPLEASQRLSPVVTTSVIDSTPLQRLAPVPKPQCESSSLQTSTCPLAPNVIAGSTPDTSIQPDESSVATYCPHPTEASIGVQQQSAESLASQPQQQLHASLTLGPPSPSALRSPHSNGAVFNCSSHHGLVPAGVMWNPRPARPQQRSPIAMVERMISNLECAQKAMAETVTSAFGGHTGRTRSRRRHCSADAGVMEDELDMPSTTDVAVEFKTEERETDSFVTSTPTAEDRVQSMQVNVSEVIAVQSFLDLSKSEDRPSDNELTPEADANEMPQQSEIVDDEVDATENDASEQMADNSSLLSSGAQVENHNMSSEQVVAGTADYSTNEDHEEHLAPIAEQQIALDDDVVVPAKKRKRSRRKAAPVNNAQSSSDMIATTTAPTVRQQQTADVAAAAAALQEQYRMQASANAMCQPSLAVFTDYCAVMPPIVAAPWMGGFVHPAAAAAFLSPPMAQPVACIPYEAMGLAVDCATSPAMSGSHLIRYGQLSSGCVGESRVVENSHTTSAKERCSQGTDVSTQTDFVDDEDDEEVEESASAAAEGVEDESMDEYMSCETEHSPAVDTSEQSNKTENFDEATVSGHSKIDPYEFEAELMNKIKSNNIGVDINAAAGLQEKAQQFLWKSKKKTKRTAWKRKQNGMALLLGKTPKKRQFGKARVAAVSHGDAAAVSVVAARRGRRHHRHRTARKSEEEEEAAAHGALESDDSGLGTSESNPREHEEKMEDVGSGGYGDDKTTGGNDSLMSRTFGIGDLVWGLIRGYTPWPGIVVPETEVKGTTRADEGKFWVRWFGDHTCSQVEPAKLKTLTEGLDLYHQVSEGHRKSRKMNASLEAAIDEAMREMDRQAVTT